MLFMFDEGICTSLKFCSCNKTSPLQVILSYIENSKENETYLLESLKRKYKRDQKETLKVLNYVNNIDWTHDTSLTFAITYEFFIYSKVDD